MTCLFVLTSAQVPPVKAFDFMDAWDAAAYADITRATTCCSGYFRWTDASGTHTDAPIVGPESQRWAAAIASLFRLDTETGAALCLRILALVQVIASCDWAGHLLQAESDGRLTPHPSLSRVASRFPLRIGGTFDATALRAELTHDAHGLAAATM